MKYYFGPEILPNMTQNIIPEYGGKYMLLSTEFKFDTVLTGFQMYASQPGDIYVEAWSLAPGACGDYPCAWRILNDWYRPTYTIVATWLLNITAGYNKIRLDDPIYITKGSIFYIDTEDHEAKLTWDISGTGLYTDFYNSPFDYDILDTLIKRRIFLSCIIDNNYYDSFVYVSHQYAKSENYELKAKFSGETSSPTYRNYVENWNSKIFNKS